VKTIGGATRNFNRKSGVWMQINERWPAPMQILRTN
jgi:hypothetical protein